MCFLISRHYSTPKYPDIIGMQNYKGKKMHSHFYRNPKDYENFKNVVVLGFGPSGKDIALELSAVCEKVTICHSRDRTKSKLPGNCFEKYSIHHIAGNGDFVTSSDDVISDVDLFIMCTGYHYDFPFIGDDVDLKMSLRTMHSLYKHIFYIDKPSLSFVGIPWAIVPFPVMHQQAGYIAAVLGGLTSLPSVEEMHADTCEEIEQRLAIPEPAHFFHKMPYKQFQYCDMLASLSGLPKNPPIIEKLFRYVLQFFVTDIMFYKKMEYRRISDDEFEIVKDIVECRD